jgi:prepilin-type N-terminal cleavage/methylation domain-containing protein
MFKKVGFTLAEVLITLSIIGVVAMMTLPALMTNVQEQQAKTGIKKGINTLSEAGQMNNAVEGFDYSSFGNTNTGADDQSIFGLLQTRVQVDMARSTVAFNEDGEAVQNGRTDAAKIVLTGDADHDATNYTVMFLKDGSALAFRPADTVAVSAGENQPSQLPCNYTGIGRGFVAFYDINGERKPNILSNCTNGQANHIKDASVPTTLSNDTVDAADCSNKDQRVIKDQFMLFFNGSNAVPANSATAWAFYN